VDERVNGGKGVSKSVGVTGDFGWAIGAAHEGTKILGGSIGLAADEVKREL
jgi:hypothetical protein